MTTAQSKTTNDTPVRKQHQKQKQQPGDNTTRDIDIKQQTDDTTTQTQQTTNKRTTSNTINK